MNIVPTYSKLKNIMKQRHIMKQRSVMRKRNIMKPLAVLFVCLFSLQTAAWADDDKPVRLEQMPQQAQNFIKKHFSGCTIALAKMESDFLSRSYDIIFTNGNKAEFDKSGAWKEVDCKYTEVPAAIIPSAIRDYVKKHYPDAKVLKIEKDNRDYEVKLSNGWELKFDKRFNVTDIDR